MADCMYFYRTLLLFIRLELPKNGCRTISMAIPLPTCGFLALDLNPLDYYAWNIIERVTNKHPHNAKESLLAAIVNVMSEINKFTQAFGLDLCSSHFKNNITNVMETQKIDATVSCLYVN